MRQLYFEVLKLLDPAGSPLVVDRDDDAVNYLDHVLPAGTTGHADGESTRPLEKAHKSLTYNNSQLSLRMTFFWRPVFNQSAIDLFGQLSQSKFVPRLVVAGSGTWNIKLSNGSDTEALLDAYARDLELVARVSSVITHSTNLIETNFGGANTNSNSLSPSLI